MQLRQRSAAQREAMVESALPTSDISDAEEGIPGADAAMDGLSGDEEGGGEPVEASEGDHVDSGAEGSEASDLYDPDNDSPWVRRRGETRRRDIPAKKRRPDRVIICKPELINEVIQTLGRVDVFDSASLKALRLTCKAFCDIVDSTGAISAAKFFSKPSAGCKALEAWLRGGRHIQRTHAISITGGLPSALAGRMLLVLSTEKPPVSKLELHGVGEAGEVLLTAPLEQLRHLRVERGTRSSRFMGDIANNPDFSGLTSLSVESGPTIDAATLVAALTHLSGLESLKLSRFAVAGDPAEPDALQNSLLCLKSLEVANCTVINQVGLLGAQGPLLLALRSLVIDSARTILVERPCLAQLTVLHLGNVQLGPGVTAALSGGPLEDLDLKFFLNNDTHRNWNWNNLELAHLTQLNLVMPSRDALANVSRARLPALRRAVLPLHPTTSSASMTAFAAGFPNLRSLTLGRLQDFMDAPSDATVEALGREILPLLEDLKLWTKTNDAAAFARNLMPGPSDSAAGHPRFPRLQSLELQLRARYGIDANYTGCIVNLARAGPHFPALHSLCVEAGYGPQMTLEAADAFVTAAKEGQSWPLLRTLRINSAYQTRKEIGRKLREMWPRLTVE